MNPLKKLDYSYVIYILCFLIVAVSLGFCSGTSTLYLPAVTEALEIPRGAFSLTTSIRYLSTAIVNMYFGIMVYKFGTKKLICAGFVSLIIFAVISALATGVYGFYAASLFMGIGLSWTSTTMVSAIINKWCKSNKGVITGAILAANGIGSAVAVQSLSPIIFSGDNPFSYRTSFYVIAIILAVMLVVTLLFFRENPKEGCSDTAPVKNKKKRDAGWEGITLASALKKPYFYLTAVCITFTGIALQGLGGIAVPHMYDIGMNMDYVAFLTSLAGILLTVAKLFTGFSYDRMGLRVTMNICFISAFISIIGLVFLDTTPLGLALAFIRSVFSSFALPLETVMLPFFVAELFGNKEFEKFLGIFASINYIGYAIGSPLGNIFYDLLGSYSLAFIIFSIMMIFVTIAMQFVYSTSLKERKLIEAPAEAII